MISWKNTTENLALVLTATVVGVFIGYKITIMTAERIAMVNERVVITAIEKPKSVSYNKVKNSAEIAVKKIKKNDSININLKTSPVTRPYVVNNEAAPCDTVAVINRFKMMTTKEFRRWKNNYKN